MDNGEAAERFRVTMELHDTGVAIMRQNLRRRHPDADDATIDELLQEWLQDQSNEPLGTLPP